MQIPLYTCTTWAMHSVFPILQKKHMMETFKGHWACLNGWRLLSELRRRHRNSKLYRYLLKTSFHALLNFIYFCYLFILLLLLVSWNRSYFVCSGFVLDLHMKYTVGWSLYVLILCGLLSCDSSPISKKCFHIPLHSWWQFRTPNGLWDVFTP